MGPKTRGNPTAPGPLEALLLPQGEAGLQSPRGGRAGGTEHSGAHFLWVSRLGGAAVWPA